MSRRNCGVEKQLQDYKLDYKALSRNVMAGLANLEVACICSIYKDSVKELRKEEIYWNEMSHVMMDFTFEIAMASRSFSLHTIP